MDGFYTPFYKQKIINEFNDVYSVMMMLKEDIDIPDDEIISIKKIENKRNKVIEYMNYSKFVGRYETWEDS